MLAGFVGEGLSLSLILSCGRAVESPRVSYVSREGLLSGHTPLWERAEVSPSSQQLISCWAGPWSVPWERPPPLRPARHHPPPPLTEPQTLFGEFVAGRPYDVTRMECK